MKNKIIKKWEIVKYEQEVSYRLFKWEDIEPGYTVSDIFANKDFDLIESFDSEEEARKEFEKYEMLMSSWVSGNTCSLRYIEEYELQCNTYEIDEDGNKDWLDYTWSEFSKIGNDILSEKSLYEMEKYENFKYDDLCRFDEKLNDYNFYIDGNNSIVEVYERQKDYEEEGFFGVTYRYKDTNIFLNCDIEFDEDGEKVIDSIYNVDFDLS